MSKSISDEKCTCGEPHISDRIQHRYNGKPCFVKESEPSISDELDKCCQDCKGKMVVEFYEGDVKASEQCYGIVHDKETKQAILNLIEQRELLARQKLIRNIKDSEGFGRMPNGMRELLSVFSHDTNKKLQAQLKKGKE